ncbi:phage tail assembly protein T [Aliarcobacter butzleri]|uniref:phage tail assembly protein T n=1 Tax=Aliarcobacter butzleri TaxID=28197 RepID=UPI003AF966F5
MSYREFLEWQIYYQDEPFLADRIELQMTKIGQITSLTGMGKIDLPNDYFIISSDFKSKKESKEVDLESQIKAIFGVKE